ncbi:netrin receptor DCC [Caerostris extrusa]|uniref:Netrin receptor DCC n=1 Tax=Caerostris extrusa TaxID=172846 RepID=A0AAV4Y1E7_CAEEX|nr:netrin receptor DCC [Caerostris extrusa]
MLPLEKGLPVEKLLWFLSHSLLSHTQWIGKGWFCDEQWDECRQWQRWYWCVFFLGLADTSVAQTTVTALQNEESNAITTAPENETTLLPIQTTTEENLMVDILMGFLNLTTDYENETKFDTESTNNDNLVTTDSCEAPWNVTVTKNLDISWTGAKRDGTVFVSIVRELDETYDADCLQKIEFSEHFNERQSPPLLKRPCYNSMYNISVELRCDNRIIHSFEQTVYTEPDVPSEITATQVTTTSFLVSWTPPPGPVEEYKVKVNSEELPATIPSLLKKDLTPESMYHVSVAARNKYEWSSWSKEISVLTKKNLWMFIKVSTLIELNQVNDLPVPQNVNGTALTDTVIRVHWDKVTLENYRIFYQVKWYESDKNSSKTFNTTNTTTMLSGLTAFTEYHIQICAGTHGAIGSFSEVIAVRTSSGVPAEPNDLYADKVDSISIALKWKDPTPFRGPILYYTVNWISNNSSVAFQEETNETFYRIEDLMPLNSYSISVSATTEAGTGRRAPQILVQTKQCKKSPKQQQQHNSSMGRSLCRKRHHKMVCSDFGTNRREKRFETLPNSFMTVHNLEPFTSYTFQVRAWSDNGASKFSNQLEVKTNIGTPLPPEKVYPRKVTNTSIEVMWKESPMFENLVIYHTVRWGAADLFREETSNRTYPPFLIRDLEPFTNYTIEVKSETIDGPGPWAEPIIVQTDVGIPLVPRNVTAYDVTNTTVMVKWDEPYPNRGPIEFYTIEWDEEDSATNVTTAFLSYFIDNLTPYQEYSIRVCAKTKEGFGDWSDPVTIQTSVGVYQAKLKQLGLNLATLIHLQFQWHQKKVSITLTKEDSLKVRWEEPSPYRGNITWYTIRWTERDSTVSSNVVTTDKHYIIANLSAYTWYTIQVRASTEVGDGDWSDPVEGRTNIGIPSIPRNLTEKKSTSRTP